MFNGPYKMVIKADYRLTGLEYEYCKKPVKAGEKVVVFPGLRIFHESCAQEWAESSQEWEDDEE